MKDLKDHLKHARKVATCMKVSTAGGKLVQWPCCITCDIYHKNSGVII
jgi:hypothetical protein